MTPEGDERESRPGGEPERDGEQAPSQTEVDDQPLGKPPPEADGDEEPLPGFPRREPPSGG